MAKARPTRVSLLERLSAGEHALTMVDDRGTVVRSILTNLTAILNARSGSAAAQMDLGLPSPHELLQGFPANLPRALQDIKACIQRYEPRLTAVTVRHLKDEDSAVAAIRFQITAMLSGDRTPLSLTTAVSGDGRVRISG